MADADKTIEDYQKEAEEYLNGWKRAKADFVNYQKQVERERAEWFMFSSVGCVKAMLPVLDSLEAGCQGSGVRDQVSGIEKIRDQMRDAVKQMGVEAIKTIGEPVNPEFHEVVAIERSEVHASGLITKEAQRGYTMHGKVLRPSKVIVAE